MYGGLHNWMERYSWIKELTFLFQKYAATSSGQRFLCLLNKYPLWNKGPIKKLVHGYPCRFRQPGKLINRTRGAGVPASVRLLDLRRRQNTGVPACIIRIEYDPCRSSFICLLRYANQVVSYILYPSALPLGSVVHSYGRARLPAFLRTGDACYLLHITKGTIVHNIEAHTNVGGQYLRAAGMYGTVLRNVHGEMGVLIRFRVGARRFFSKYNRATVGALSAQGYRHRVLASAGRKRRNGYRPVVRGVAKNPVDHAHGGTGKKKVVPRTAWGKLLKWKKTAC